MFRGTVTDQEGNAVPDVMVTVTTKGLSSYREIETTNKRGQFRLRIQRQQVQYTFDLLFEKSEISGLPWRAPEQP